jgi:hypothetical protein
MITEAIYTATEPLRHPKYKFVYGWVVVKILIPIPDDDWA